MFQSLERIFQSVKRMFQSLEYIFQGWGNIKKIRGLDVFVGSNGKNVVLVKMFFRVEGHIIIFKEEVGKVVIDASTCEFDNGFLLCPKTGEGDLRIWS